MNPVLLSKRERQICDRLEYPDKQICAALGVSFGTLRVHLTNALRKYHAHSRCDLQKKFLAEKSEAFRKKLRERIAVLLRGQDRKSMKP